MASSDDTEQLRARIEVVLGDITQQRLDAIVNAANNALLGGGGVDGAIHLAAGPQLLEECRKLGGCPTGEAKLTRGYKLPARHVIHTVGPVWYGGNRGEPELLARCYRRSLEVALQHDLTSIAFCAISTGVYGYPLTPATRIAVREVTDALRRYDSIRKVVFTCFDRTTYQTYLAVLAQELGGESAAANAAAQSSPGLAPTGHSSPGFSISGSMLIPGRPSNPPHLPPLERARLEERILGGLWGAVVGDALGVPVEFQLRSTLDEQPVTDLRGFGTYKVPAGTWSDDSSLLLCTLYSLIGPRLDAADLAQRFVRFLDHAYMTPAGEVFDIGTTTASAIARLREGVPPEEAGSDAESDNGNGSLMRILPVPLRFYRLTDTQLVKLAHSASSLTHRHPRSRLACGYLSVFAKYLIGGDTPKAAYSRANAFASSHYSTGIWEAELPHFARVLSGHIGELPRSVVPSAGYVIHTLEASLWCLLTTRSYEEAVLAAVNLGGDTDTTACVTGGLAGIYHGLTQVPERWRKALARSEDLDDLFARFVARVLSGSQT